MEEMSITIKGLKIGGTATEESGMFKLESIGDIRITADPTTLSSVVTYLKEVLQNEN